MKWNLFNSYEIRARLIPTFITISPLLLGVLILTNRLRLPSLSSILFTLIMTSSLYILSFYIRTLGKELEKNMKKTWGGYPSALVLLNSNKLLDEHKSEIVKILNNNFNASIDLDNDSEEIISKKTQSKFEMIRQTLRRDDPEGIWKQHNEEYGAIRNMTAATLLYTDFSLLIIIEFIILFKYSNNIAYLGITAIIGILSVISLLIRFFIQPKMVKKAADTYAKSAWLCFLATQIDKSESEQ